MWQAVTRPLADAERSFPLSPDHLVPFWVAEVEPRHLHRFIPALAVHFPIESRYLHLRRVEQCAPSSRQQDKSEQHQETPQQEQGIVTGKRVLVCPVSVDADDASSFSQDLLWQRLLEEAGFAETTALPRLDRVAVPREPPTTKEEVRTFKEAYWPCALPARLARPPAAPPTDALLRRLTYYMDKVIADARSEKADGSLPMACLLAPTNSDGEFLDLESDDTGSPSLSPSIALTATPPVRLIARDERVALARRTTASAATNETDVSEREYRCAMSASEVRLDSGHLLGHATMHALAQLAALPDVPEKYLATRHIAFLSHEPCVMCAMALVHSRIVAVYFHQADPIGGGFSRFFLHENKDINHRFPVTQYLSSTTAPSCCPDRLSGTAARA